MIALLLLGCGPEPLPQGTLCRRDDTIEVVLALSGCASIVEEPTCTVSEVQTDRVLDVTGAIETDSSCVPSGYEVTVSCGPGFEPGDVVVYDDLVTLFELVPECPTAL